MHRPGRPAPDPRPPITNKALQQPRTPTFGAPLKKLVLKYKLRCAPHGRALRERE